MAIPKVVFATAFDQYAVKAFEVNAVDYLLKPFDKKRVAQAIQRAREQMSPANSSQERLEALVKMLETQRQQPAKLLIRPPDACSSPIRKTFATRRLKMG